MKRWLIRRRFTVPRVEHLGACWVALVVVVALLAGCDKYYLTHPGKEPDTRTRERESSATQPGRGFPVEVGGQHN